MSRTAQGDDKGEDNILGTEKAQARKRTSSRDRGAEPLETLPTQNRHALNDSWTAIDDAREVTRRQPSPSLLSHITSGILATRRRDRRECRTELYRWRHLLRAAYTCGQLSDALMRDGGWSACVATGSVPFPHASFHLVAVSGKRHV